MRGRGGRGRKESVGDGTGWRRVFKRLIGAPDYESYLEHCRAAGHPPRLSEREFVAQFFESKGKGPRCC